MYNSDVVVSLLIWYNSSGTVISDGVTMNWLDVVSQVNTTINMRQSPYPSFPDFVHTGFADVLLPLQHINRVFLLKLETMAQSHVHRRGVFRIPINDQPTVGAVINHGGDTVVSKAFFAMLRVRSHIELHIAYEGQVA